MAVLGPMEQVGPGSASISRWISPQVDQNLHRPRPGPHPLLEKVNEAGKLGMKTGEGFRRWTPEQANAVRERLRRFLAEQVKARRLESR